MNLNFKYLSKEEVYPSKYFNLFKESFELPDGKQKSFEVHKGGKVVVVFPITKENKVVCVRQYRVGPKKSMTELPAGFVDKGETVIQAAKRELLEETGFSGDFKFIQTVYPDSYSTIQRHVYICKNAVKVQDPNLDDSEFIEVELLDIDKFREHIKNGQLTHLGSAYLALDFMNLL